MSHEEKNVPFQELITAISRRRTLAAQACDALTAATPALVEAIRHRSGQSLKIERILWAAWNGELCDQLAGLDTDLAQAAVAMIAARAHMTGNADPLLRKIIVDSGSQAPSVSSCG